MASKDTVEVRLFGDDFAKSLVGMDPKRNPEVVTRMLDRSAFLIQVTAQTKTIKRGGKGKPLAAKLTSRTGTLRRSIRVNRVSRTIRDIGTDLRYGAVHEQGGNLSVKAHTRERQTVSGRTVAFVPRGTVLASRTINVKAHKRFVPKRPFLDPAQVLAQRGMAKIMKEEWLRVVQKAPVPLPAAGVVR